MSFPRFPTSPWFSSLADKLRGTAAQNKKAFDDVSNEHAKQAHDALCDALEAGTAAAQIGAKDGENDSTVQAELNAAKTHRENQNNPHGVTAAQIGAVASSEKGTTVATLYGGKVPLSQLPLDDAPTSGSDNALKSGAAKTALDGKVNKETGKGLSTNDYDATEKAAVAANTAARHSHDNKSVLDDITSTVKSGYDAVVRLLTDIESVVNSLGNDNTTIPTSKAVADALAAHYVTAGKKINTTLGTKATAEGSNTTASGNYSHAGGLDSTASGNYSTAVGYNNVASAQGATAEGANNIASGVYSHAQNGGGTGDTNTANGTSSSVGGRGNVANHRSQVVWGEFNEADGSSNASTARGDFVEIIGNGTADDDRSNARTLDWYGNETLAGKLTLGAAPSANMDAATKEYVDNKSVPSVVIVDVDPSESTNRDTVREAVLAGKTVIARFGETNYLRLVRADFSAYAETGQWFCYFVGITLYTTLTVNAGDIAVATISSIHNWSVNKYTKGLSTNDYTAEEKAKVAAAIPSTAKGAVNGVAELGEDGKVPQSQLPAGQSAPIAVFDYDDFGTDWLAVDVVSAAGAGKAVFLRKDDLLLPLARISEEEVDGDVYRDTIFAGLDDRQHIWTAYVSEYAEQVTLTDHGAVATASALAGKVDKVAGKGLSTNDYDATEKAAVAANTAARHVHASGSVDVSAAEKTAWSAKQDALTAGENITIANGVISATGGGAEGAYELIEKIIAGFSVTTSEPSDWATAWTNYYTNTGTVKEPVYTALTDATAPTWESGTYYKKSSYVSQIVRSADTAAAPYDFRKVIVRTTMPSAAQGFYGVKFQGENAVNAAAAEVRIGNGYDTQQKRSFASCEFKNGYLFAECGSMRSAGTTNSYKYPMLLDTMFTVTRTVHRVQIGTAADSQNIPADAVIEIWAVR